MNKMRLLSSLILLALAVLPKVAMADSCNDIVELHNQKQLKTATLLESTKPQFSVVVCRSKGQPVYAEFYTYIHFDRHQYGVPKGGLTAIKKALNRDMKTRITGVLTAGPQLENLFTLKFRARFENGDFVDVAENLTLKTGESGVFSQADFIVGVARLPVSGKSD